MIWHWRFFKLLLPGLTIGYTHKIFSYRAMETPKRVVSADAELAAMMRKKLNEDVKKISRWKMPEPETCNTCKWADRLDTDPHCCHLVGTRVMPAILPELPLCKMGLDKIHDLGRSSIGLNFNTAIGCIGYSGERLPKTKPLQSFSMSGSTYSRILDF